MVYIIILTVLAIVGISFLAYVAKKDKTAIVVEQSEKCCGAHEVCETEVLERNLKNNLEYFEDEELDAYQGKEAQEYSDEEVDEFREVLFTLKTDEVMNWFKSLEFRQIIPPSVIKQEAATLVNECVSG